VVGEQTLEQLLQAKFQNLGAPTKKKKKMTKKRMLCCVWLLGCGVET